MNPSAITALVDRWRPETHSFHLRTGEMTVTLQDMSLILALPVEGKQLCIDTSCEDWRGKMFDLIGKVPDDIVNKKGEKLRVSAGATFSWISQNFKTCPEGASQDVVKLYARVYVWYVITRTLLPDSSGNTAQWHWLKALTNMETKWSWGSAALAFLYRQERFPVGRPKVFDYKDYEDHGNQLRLPTWAYKWDVVSEFSGDPVAAYWNYTNEFDNLTPEQVEWEPYGPRSKFGDPLTFALNPACMMEATLWYMHCPLVCMWAVEHHMPQRVMRQYGLL
ncbi:hypothetical protein QYE76_060178 [Lolium multiflorum]|uniref:Aminotransferase-like plant mobile domain-containing protein n=1 Tax=Lolium multiflorum TaxID=4521 RepID=A0AAD8RZY6_LOLMU|nr:hypothetical protein QYE76_060178 [Lolium multiflorum]